MKLHQLHLTHFRGCQSIALKFHPRLTVLAGVNGAGKTSFLDAIALLLSWPAARVRRENAPGMMLKDTDIQNGKPYSALKLELNNGVSWQLVKPAKGHSKPADQTDMKGATELARSIRDDYSQNTSDHPLPVFAYYPVTRAVLDIPLRIRQKHDFDSLALYSNSLTSAANFRDFFEWFRNREDLENEYRRMLGETNEGPDDLIAEPDTNYSYQAQVYPDRQLEAVRMAVEQFLPGFKSLSVRRSPLRMVVRKQGKEVRIDQLSDGEKCTLALVGDLARRLAIANPMLQNPLEGEGIVLIDEIELHLHPRWQRHFVAQLGNLFPNCQFVVTTHSPQALGEVKGENIRLLYAGADGNITSSTPDQALGLDSNYILEVLMDSSEREQETAKELNRLFELIDRARFEEAEEVIEQLKMKFNGTSPELLRAETLIAMEKM
ncbi:MAG: AAA family ATPase [Bacteroidales bacterium]|nr:AAA family ATPase [Bacteroidales bacterium]